MGVVREGVELISRGSNPIQLVHLHPVTDSQLLPKQRELLQNWIIFGYNFKNLNNLHSKLARSVEQRGPSFH
jgi:hypothetical protein